MKCEVAGGGSVTSPVEGTSGEVDSDRLVIAEHIPDVNTKLHCKFEHNLQCTKITH